MGLETYRHKRDFQRTPEPRGGEGQDGHQGARFVVQKHDARRLHYDFRLELDGVLLSWAVPKGPSLDPRARRLAVRTEDHPLEYAGFEGVIPSGEYGAGPVLVWDHGTWEPEGDPRQGLRRGRLRFRLTGQKLRGSWQLVRLKDEQRREQWLLIKRRDAEAATSGADDGSELVERAPRSVLSGRDLREVAEDPQARRWRSSRRGEPAPARSRHAGPGARHAVPGARAGALPERVAPQLARSARAAPEGPGWLHEVKLDGYRLLARVEAGAARLFTRRGQDWTDRFPRVAAAAAALPCRAALLDGEVVVLDEQGLSSFQRLQRALGGASDAAPVLFAFDLLHLDGQDLTPAPLRARKAALRRLLAGVSRGGPLRYADHLEGDGPRVFEAATRRGLEGIVSKQVDAPYAAGQRPGSWLKIKSSSRQDLVVVGWTPRRDAGAHLGALLLAVREGQRWRLVGRVGTGFDRAERGRLRARLEPLARDTPVVRPAPRGAAARGVRWVEPRLVVEVAFLEWTSDGKVRQAVYQGVREDARASDVRRELPAPGTMPANGRPAPVADEPGRAGGVRITHPDRVLFPEAGVTKLELARYYARVAERMLPLAQDRPLTLLRCPSGRGAACFYQKHARPGLPTLVPRVRIEGEAEEFLALDGAPALLTLVQHGVLEFHLWGSRRDRLDRPDRLVFDLDPGPGVSWEAVAWAARHVRERLDALDLQSFLLATGGAGLHVVVPLERRAGWDAVKAFAAGLARGLARELPDVFVAKAAKRARQGRIFVDYLRNGFGASAIAPWSARARPGAPIALPLGWDELDPQRQRLVTVREVDEALARPDPWEGYGAVRQSISRGRLRAVEGARRG